jgi:hypothetical protein
MNNQMLTKNHKKAYEKITQIFQSYSEKNSIEPPTGGINPQAYNPAVVIGLVRGRRSLEHMR